MQLRTRMIARAGGGEWIVAHTHTNGPVHESSGSLRRSDLGHQFPENERFWSDRTSAWSDDRSSVAKSSSAWSDDAVARIDRPITRVRPLDPIDQIATIGSQIAASPESPHRSGWWTTQWRTQMTSTSARTTQSRTLVTPQLGTTTTLRTQMTAHREPATHTRMQLAIVGRQTTTPPNSDDRMCVGRRPHHRGQPAQRRMQIVQLVRRSTHHRTQGVHLRTQATSQLGEAVQLRTHLGATRGQAGNTRMRPTRGPSSTTHTRKSPDAFRTRPIESGSRLATNDRSLGPTAARHFNMYEPAHQSALLPVAGQSQRPHIAMIVVAIRGHVANIEMKVMSNGRR